MNDLLKSLAPLLGSAIAGPFGGIAASFIADKLGVPERTVQAVTEALGNVTPEQAAQVRAAEVEFKKWLADNDLKREQLAYTDTQGARDMFSSTKSVTPSILTWIVVTLTLIAEGALLFNQIPPGADPIILGRVLGTMDSALMLVLGFWFGSSHGSQNKDALLAQAGPVK